MATVEIIAMWGNAALKERSAAQEHFIDLCRLADTRTPLDATVCAACGWSADLSDADILSRLLDLNRSRSA